MNFGRCEKCKEYVFTDGHNCEAFYVYYPEYYGEEWKEIYGVFEDDIIERIAQEINQDDPVFDTELFEEPILIKNKDGEIKKFQCRAEVDIVYHVDEIEE